jgi:uncharacterized protein YxeA
MSEQLGKDQIIFTSVIISIIVAFVICIIPHFDTSKYYYMPNSSGSGYYTGASSVLYATYECGFGERHQLNSNNLNVSDLYDKRSNNLIGDTFEHFLLLLIIAVVLTIIISAIWIRSEDEEKFKEIK